MAQLGAFQELLVDPLCKKVGGFVLAIFLWYSITQEALVM
jgi:hypothetical protein